jgi:threonine/homoserine/homoserine lactone efflux protein
LGLEKLFGFNLEIMLHFLIIGLVLGLSAGFSPGPLLTLVVAETLRHDIRAGIKVAIAPIFTDLPIIACAVFVLGRVSQSHLVLAIISFCGAAFVARMGIENIRTNGHSITLTKNDIQSSLSKGIMANIFSPHPYLFWLTIGVPILGRAIRHDFSQVLIFLASFYTLLVGSKVLLAVLIGNSRQFLSGRMYVYIMRFLGVVLCILAATLFYDGLQLLFSNSAVF